MCENSETLMEIKDQRQSNQEPLGVRMDASRTGISYTRGPWKVPPSSSPGRAPSRPKEDLEMLMKSMRVAAQIDDMAQEPASLLKRIEDDDVGRRMSSIVQQRTAQDTEAAHDLLQLANSLPALHRAEDSAAQRSAVVVGATMLVMLADEEGSKSAYPPLTPPVSDCSSSDGRSSPDPTPTAQRSAGGRKPRRFRCNECSRDYATSSNLSRHKQTHRAVESGGAKSCPTCGKAYVSKPALSMHLLTHRREHVCPICSKPFSRPWLLQGHVRSHTGEKPYTCDQCFKAFADRSNLRAHMQTHSSVKSFRCTVCHKSFALKSYLHKHQETSNCHEKN